MRATKRNMIIFLLVLILLWLGYLTWLIFSLQEDVKLHEFWIKEALEMAN